MGRVYHLSASLLIIVLRTPVEHLLSLSQRMPLLRVYEKRQEATMPLKPPLAGAFALGVPETGNQVSINSGLLRLKAVYVLLKPGKTQQELRCCILCADRLPGHSSERVLSCAFRWLRGEKVAQDVSQCGFGVTNTSSDSQTDLLGVDTVLGTCSLVLLLSTI
jgi:hypothetical protein